MTMIIATLAWAFAAFVILHDNAKTRRDLTSFRGQFDGNMKSFWSRLFDGEKKLEAAVKVLADLGRYSGVEIGKLEQKAFFEMNELRQALAQNVDNMSDRFQATDEAIGSQNHEIESIRSDMKARLVREFIGTTSSLKAPKKGQYTPVKRTKKSTGSRARA